MKFSPVLAPSVSTLKTKNIYKKLKNYKKQNEKV